MTPFPTFIEPTPFSKTKSIFCNPLLIGIILTIVFLMVLNIPFEAYDKGGSIIKIFISPVESVIIGVALYEQFQILKTVLYFFSYV